MQPSILPAGTPQAIIDAISEMETTAHCCFLSDLTEEPDSYIIEAELKQKMVPFRQKAKRYRVKLVIPKNFPLDRVDIIPVDPAYRWNAHQNGDWPFLGNEANIICPPEEHLLLEPSFHPFIDNALSWLEAADQDKLVSAGDDYEIPHFKSDSADINYVIYTEGGVELLNTFKNAGGGMVWLHQVNEGKAFIARKFLDFNGNIIHESALSEDVLGKETGAGWAGWIMVGDPVARKPHQPALSLSQLSPTVMKRLLKAMSKVYGMKSPMPLVITGFEIPVMWGGKPENLIWQGIEFRGMPTGLFDIPKGFRKGLPVTQLPAVISYFKRHDQIKWVSTIDMSRQALLSRSGAQNIFSDMKVAVLGAGSLGSMIIKNLHKANPKKLAIFDRQLLEPGNLIRHELTKTFVGIAKAASLRELSQPLFKDQQVLSYEKDIVENWSEVEGQLKEYDLVIDATANPRIQHILDCSKKLKGKKLCNVGIKPKAAFGLMTMLTIGGRYSSGEVEMLAKCDLHSSLYNVFSKPSGHTGMVRPEPGCFHPTFEGDYAKIRYLSDAFFLGIERWLLHSPQDVVSTIIHSSADEGSYISTLKAVSEVIFPSDDSVIIWHFPESGVEVEIKESLLKKICTYGRAALPNEMAGTLVGVRKGLCWQIQYLFQANPVHTSRWPTGVMRPHDKVDTKLAQFQQCGLEYIGEWHTHPHASPSPSQTDIDSMNKLSKNPCVNNDLPVLIIAGRNFADPNDFSCSLTWNGKLIKGKKNEAVHV